MTAESATHVLTDEGVPVGWSIIADHPEMAYLADPDASRPATAGELAAVEDRARAEYEAFLAVPVSPRPHPPMCACNRKEAAQEPEPAAVTVVDQPAAAEPEPEPADDPAPVLDPIAELALSRFTAAFAEDPDGEGDRAQPDATAQIPVTDAITTTTPAITEGGAE